MANLQLDIAQWQRCINELVKEGETEQNKQRIKELTGWILRAQKDYYATRSQLQRFKIFAAVFESAPQFILQWSIFLHKVHAGAILDWTDPIFWLQTISSIGSVMVSFAGMTCELPMLVYETQRSPIRSFSFQYFKVLPLVALNVTPRLLVMVSIGSFVSLEDWPFYLPFTAIYLGFCMANHITTKNWMMKQHPILRNSHRLIDLGLFTSIICPSVIGVFNSGFFLATSLSTTLIHSIALGSLYTIGFYHPSMIFESLNHHQDHHQDHHHNHHHDHLMLSQKQVEERDFNFLQWYAWILIPTLLIFCNFITFCTSKIVKWTNDLHMAVWAIDANKPEAIKASILPKLNELVPSDQDNNSLLQYYIKKNDDISARLIEKSIEKDLDLCQTNKQDKTALMLGCDLALPGTVEALLKIVKVGQNVKIGVNQISYFNHSNSALHFAALSEGPQAAKKQVIKLFWIHANALKINLLLRNDHGKTPVDILEETHQGRSWLQEFGNPKLELMRLENALGADDRNEAIAIKNNFPMSLDLSLIYATQAHEEVAVAMIKNSTILNLQLTNIDEKKTNLLSLACCLKKSKAALALIDQAVIYHKDIGINAIDDTFGYTPFIWACYHGLVDVVAKMILETSNGLKIDLNAKDDLGRTGFIWACIYKQIEVVKLLGAKADSHHIDLHCKDIFGKTGFDRWPQVIKTIGQPDSFYIEE